METATSNRITLAVIFDGPPSHKSGHLLRVENSNGASLSMKIQSQWHHSGDSLSALILGRDRFVILDEERRFVELEDRNGRSLGVGFAGWEERGEFGKPESEWALVLDADLRTSEDLLAALSTARGASVCVHYDQQEAVEPLGYPVAVEIVGSDEPWHMGATIEEALLAALESHESQGVA